jgi:hypothetical protein
MLKSFSMSFSLAVALGMCSVSMAGPFSNCSTCGLASPQGTVAPSAQGVVATSCDTCAPKHKLFSGVGGCLSGLKSKLHSLAPTTSYEWVLKKKHTWGHKEAGCSTCAAPVYATGQVSPAAQSVLPAGQYAAPTYGTGQHAFAPYKPAATIASVPSEMTPATPGGEEVPPAPAVEVKETSARGLLLPTPAGN